MKKLIVIGASSGLGHRVAADFARMGWRVGVAARREEPLKELQAEYPGQVEYAVLDVAADDAVERFHELIDRLGGMDYLLYAAGCGWYNPELNDANDNRTVQTNVVGFTRIVTAAYKYYRRGHCGHIAAITSVAGTKGMGVSATYSATKRYQWTYLQALDQLARRQAVDVTITDIRPGFVDTPLLSHRRYPMEMTVDYAAPRIELAMLRARRVAYIDARWGAVSVLWSLLPGCIWRHIPLGD